MNEWHFQIISRVHWRSVLFFLNLKMLLCVLYIFNVWVHCYQSHVTNCHVASCPMIEDLFVFIVNRDYVFSLYLEATLKGSQGNANMWMSLTQFAPTLIYKLCPNWPLFEEIVQTVLSKALRSSQQVLTCFYFYNGFIVVETWRRGVHVVHAEL